MTNQYQPTKLDKIIDVGELYSLHYFSYSKNFVFEGEAHNFWEIIYCDSGQADITDEGDSFALCQGECFIHAPGQFHTVRPGHPNTNVIVFAFDGRLDPLKGLSKKVLSLSSTEKSFIKLLLGESSEVFSSPLNIVYQYSLELKQDFSAYSAQLIKNYIECLLLSLLGHLRKDANRVTFSPNQNQKVITETIIATLRDNIHEKLTLQTLAYKLGYSQSYLKKVFKNTLGTSIIKYYINLKIQKAKDYLSQGHYSVSQVSELLGYDTVQYFTKQFKEVVNMTPTAFIKAVEVTGLLP